jgi:DNA-binding CsgD family transcriptional regulator
LTLGRRRPDTLNHMDLEAVRRRARELVAQGATAEGLAMLEAAADETAATDGAAAARLLVEAASVALMVGGPNRAVSVAERAVETARDPAGLELQRASIRLGDALSWAGRYDEARRAWLQASLGDAEDEPVMLAERANALLRLGDPAAHDASYRALVAARLRGDPELVVDALNLATIAEVRAGRLKEALGAAEQAVAQVAGTGTVEEFDCLGLVAWVLAVLGHEARCRAVVAEIGRGMEERRVTVSGGLAMGLLALSKGASEEAAVALEAKLAGFHYGPVAAMTMLRPYAAELVEANARAGRRGNATRVLAATLPVALGSGQPRLIAPMRRAQGILEDDEDAFRHALDAHAGWDNRFEVGRTRLAFGEHLRRHRRRAEARLELEAAVADYEHVGSVLWRERAIAELRLAGERLPARRPLPASAPEALTRQEGEILELVRAGLSNREIAERLVLSVKTVEGHLTTVYGKLGVASRAQALAVLAANAPD